MASKKVSKKPTMAEAYKTAKGEGASPQARRAQSARMTGQANRGSATENLAKRIKTDAARKKAVPGFKTDTVRKTVDTGYAPTLRNIKKSLEVQKALIMPGQSAKRQGILSTKYEITKPYKGKGSQASKKKGK